MTHVLLFGNVSITLIWYRYAAAVNLAYHVVSIVQIQEVQKNAESVISIRSGPIIDTLRSVNRNDSNGKVGRFQSSQQKHL